MKNSKIRFGIVGCGRISNKHFEALSGLPDTEIAAVCDIQKDRAKAAGEKLGVPFYFDYDEMLTKEEMDVVSILTPSGLHAEHTIDIVKKYEKHIICEKPMALRLEDADNMIHTCDEHGVRLFIVKQNRFNLPVTKLRDAFESGRFGKIVMGTVRVRWCRRQDYYERDAWRGTWEMDGGVITNQASHHVDLLQWMLGEPISVMAKTATQLVNIEVEDTAAAIIKFRSGAIGIIEATTATRPKDLEGSLSVLGENGSVVIEGFAVNELKTWEFSPEEDNDKEILTKFKENPPDVYGFGHKRYLQNVINSIKSGKRALVEGLEGRKTIELINAIYESAETGKEIFLRFQPRRSKLGVHNENL